MEKINDKIFGEMTYKHSWTKRDKFIFLNKEYEINIVAQAYKGDDILETQQNNFVQFQEFLNKNAETIKEKLVKYLKEIFDINTKLDDILEPTSVIFERDNSWGVLFECDCDIENGLAVFIKNGEIKVGSQDDFL